MQNEGRMHYADSMKTRKLIAGTAAAALLLAAVSLHSQETPIPTTFAAGDAPSQTVDAGSSATPPESSQGILGFKSKVGFHKFSGWMSAGLLLAAGVVGGIHALSMKSEAHAWRDAHDIHEYDTGDCVDEIEHVWNDPGQQALRWTHVGLLAAGETFYLANAFTGTSLMAPLAPGWNKPRIHRYAFFVHATLMVAEGVLGFMTSDALKRGDHGQMMDLLTAHAAIGIAIPLVIIGSGAIMSRPEAAP